MSRSPAAGPHLQCASGLASPDRCAGSPHAARKTRYAPNPLPEGEGARGGDWIDGGADVVFQQCSACHHVWYFRRSFCPGCGHAAPSTLTSTGLGSVHASTLVQRAPSDAFRAIAPYRLVLVDMAEGFRMMGHADPSLTIGERVRCRVKTIAGRVLPYFDREPA